MSAPLRVWEKVLSFYKENYEKKSSEEFKQGFLKCLDFYKVGIKKEDHFNLNLKVYGLEKDNHNKDLIIKKQREELATLRQQINQTSFISGLPTTEYKHYELPNISNGQAITFVVNMEKETLLMLWKTFTQRYKWNQPDECKSKLISFINRFENGFKAYKDVKTARKEGVRL